MTTDAADYHARATEHRPRGLEEIRAAIHRMLDEGLAESTVATAFGLSVEAIRRLVGCRDCE